MKKKYIPIPIPAGSPTPPTPSINWMSDTEWADLDFTEKVSEGLTLVGNENSFRGRWYDYTDVNVDCEDPVIEHYSAGTTGIDETITLEDDGVYLVVNYEIYGDSANVRRTTADVTTTAQIDSYQEDHTDYTAVSDRDMSVSVYVISATSGDTVTLTNTHFGAQSVQAHLIFKCVNPFTVESELIVARFTDVTSETYTAEENEKIIAFAINSVASVANVSSSGIESAAVLNGEYSETSQYISATMALYTLSEDDTVIMRVGSYYPNNSKAFLVYKIIPA